MSEDAMESSTTRKDNTGIWRPRFPIGLGFLLVLDNNMQDAFQDRFTSKTKKGVEPLFWAMGFLGSKRGLQLVFSIKIAKIQLKIVVVLVFSKKTLLSFSAFVVLTSFTYILFLYTQTRNVTRLGMQRSGQKEIVVKKRVHITFLLAVLTLSVCFQVGISKFMFINNHTQTLLWGNGGGGCIGLFMNKNKIQDFTKLCKNSLYKKLGDNLSHLKRHLYLDI